MNNKTIIVGIDSLDINVIRNHLDRLPNFKSLFAESPTKSMGTVFPADTIPAWVSAYTGLEPGKHGIFYIYDVFDPNLSDLRKIDISCLQGKTFWDFASAAGKRCVLIFPMLIFPNWKINGTAIGKSPFERRIGEFKVLREISAYPEDIFEKYGIPASIEDISGGFPGIRKMSEWAEYGKTILNRETSLAIRLLKEEKWDLFFVYLSVLDIIQHRTWRFYDRNDPTYCKDRDLESIIPSFYSMMDNFIGEFMKFESNATLIVMSDHGHESRPFKTININEILRQNGYLMLRKRNISNKIMQTLRDVILTVAFNLDIESDLVRLVSLSGKMTRTSKTIYSSSNVIDVNRSKATLSTFAGIKSYPHGGISINNDMLSTEEYENLRIELTRLLQNIRDPISKEPIMNWIAKREDISTGPFSTSIYPDIIFRLRDNLGVGWSIDAGIFGKAFDHKIASGGHSNKAVFLIRKPPKMIMQRELKIIDVAPTILDALGIDFGSAGFDGHSIFEYK